MHFKRISRIVGTVALGLTVGVLAAGRETSRKDRDKVARATDEAGNIKKIRAELAVGNSPQLAADKFELLEKAIKQKAPLDGVEVPLLWQELADRIPACKASLESSGYWKDLADCLHGSTSLNPLKDLAIYLASKLTKVP